MKLLIAIVGAILGATGAYGAALMLSTSDEPAYVTVATAVFGGFFLSAVFAGIHSAFTAE